MWAGAGLVLLALLATAAWSIGQSSPWGRVALLPIGVVAALILGLVGFWAVRRVGDAGRAGRIEDDEGADPLDPAALARAADAQSARAREFIDKIRDAERRSGLQSELERLEAARSAPAAELHVVIFGTVSAGKTSLINALMGRRVGETSPVMGTTRRGETHVHSLKGVAGTVHLIDTPGISEAGEGAVEREDEARDLARRADLLLFVVDHDLIRSEHVRLIELARLGKRSIAVLNKKDRFTDDDLAAIVAKLRDRLGDVVAAEDVVTAAAAPRPIQFRTMCDDGSYDTVLEVQEPDLRALRARIVAVLSDEGHLLRVANLLVQTNLLTREAEAELNAERRQRADEVIDRYQWVTAAAVFANPIPAMNLLAGASVQSELIAELARVYGAEPSKAQLHALAASMGRAILKTGLVEAAASIVAGLIKRSPATFVAGGALQAATMAYLARIVGKSFNEYFRNGESWGDEGIEGVVLRQFELNSRSEFLQDFARQAVQRFWSRIKAKAAPFGGGDSV